MHRPVSTLERSAGGVRLVGLAGRRLAGVSPHLVFAPLALLGGLAAAVLGAVRRFIDVDGISYLDVADAYLAGGWAAGANAYWSPLYPWLLAGATRISGAGRESELAVAQVVNFSVFVLALAAFVAFWGELARARGTGGAGAAEDRGFGPWAWWAMGYALFAWSAFRLVTVWGTTPDLLVLAAVLAAGATLVRMHRRPASWLLPAGLGLILGLGYLAKAVMFPVSLAFVVSAWGAVRGVRGATARAGLVLVVFALVAGPFVATLSLQKGRFTFGDSGRLNYARFVNGVPDIHWRGEPAGSGTPQHPTRRLSTEPAVYEFATPVGGTYPVWYDPTYWYEGVTVRFDAGQQFAALVRTGYGYTELVLKRQGAALAALVLLLAAMGPARRWGLPALGRYWFVWLPALAGMGLYALVYMEGRYVAPFLVLCWGVALAAVRLPDDRGGARLLGAGAFVVALVLGINLVAPKEKLIARYLRPAQLSPGSGGGARYDVGPSGASAQLPAARALAELGLRPGDPVAYVGYGYYAYWARLAGVRIVAEIPSADAHFFWEADEDGRARIVRTLAAAGPRAIVIEASSAHPPPQGWHRLGHTGYYLLPVTRD
jgi:hypothetical protein